MGYNCWSLIRIEGSTTSCYNSQQMQHNRNRKNLSPSPVDSEEQQLMAAIARIEQQLQESRQREQKLRAINQKLSNVIVSNNSNPASRFLQQLNQTTSLQSTSRSVADTMKEIRNSCERKAREEVKRSLQVDISSFGKERPYDENNSLLSNQSRMDDCKRDNSRRDVSQFDMQGMQKDKRISRKEAEVRKEVQRRLAQK